MKEETYAYQLIKGIRSVPILFAPPRRGRAATLDADPSRFACR